MDETWENSYAAQIGAKANQKLELDVEGVVVEPSEVWHGVFQPPRPKSSGPESVEEKTVTKPWLRNPQERAEDTSYRKPKDTVLTEERRYIDKTGTDEKPNPLRDVYHEFPLAMIEIAKVTAYGMEKHANRGWRTFKPSYGIGYHTGKLGRHLLAEETDGPINKNDGGLLHAAQVAWNALARLEHMLMFDR